MKALCFLLPSILLTGCLGTWATDREADTDQPYPSLHSVPDRPPKKDFKLVEAKVKKFEKDYDRALTKNQKLRAQNPLPVKPEGDD